MLDGMASEEDGWLDETRRRGCEGSEAIVRWLEVVKEDEEEEEEEEV